MTFYVPEFKVRILSQDLDIPVNDEDIGKEYLLSKGWVKIDERLWNHRECTYDCGYQAAMKVQQLRDKE